MRLLVVVILFVLIVAGAFSLQCNAVAKPPVSVEASPYLIERVKNEEWLLIDVRSKEEYNQGHIPGAVNMPHDQIQSYLDELDGWQDKPVIVYCRSGRRAQLAMKVLEDLKFTSLRSLEGDMLGWSESGLPVSQM
ncbi:rhodanese-like domain-containing protein [Alteromonas sp. H39]|uniref:rhodanese-like domain-containing protein n=1 Tax=Alteromonas sp. H39 TaxID=3389876 RepID=UPI0039E0B1AF